MISPSLRIAKTKLPKDLLKLASCKERPINSELSVTRHSANILSSCSSSSCVSFSSASITKFSISFSL